MVKHIKRSDFVPWVRYINGLTIYGRKKDEVIATDGKNSVLCERWVSPLYFYDKHWDEFIRRLKRNNSLVEIGDIWKFALKYEISAHTPAGFPEVPKDIRVLPEKWS